MNRATDILGAAVLLVVTAPIVAVAALAVRLTSPGPVLFRAERIGRHGVPFPVLKLRTMVSGAGGPHVTAGNDPRVTPVGRVLRLLAIDELPQLVNVLRGQMSLVGPRPEDPRYVAVYTDAQRALLAVRPGLTGAAALAFRDEQRLLASYDDPERAYVDIVLPQKLDLELRWLQARSFRGDSHLLAATVVAVLRGRRVPTSHPRPGASQLANTGAVVSAQCRSRTR